MPQHYLHTNRSGRTCCLLLNLYFSLSLRLYLRFDCSSKQSLNLRRIYSSFSLTAIHEIYFIYFNNLFPSIELRSLYEVPKMFHNSYANAGNAKASSILYLIYSNCCWYIFIVYEIHLIHKTYVGYYNLMGIYQMWLCLILSKVKFALELTYYWN